MSYDNTAINRFNNTEIECAWRGTGRFLSGTGVSDIPGMFSPEEAEELSEHLNWLIENWAVKDAGWSGPWRKKYMDTATEKKSKLIALHDLQYYSDAWCGRW